MYAPNKGDPHFFHNVNKTLGEMEGQIILAGDFNQVLDPCPDRSKFRGPLMPKDRAAIHMINEDVGLVDVWRLINLTGKEYTFFFTLPKILLQDRHGFDFEHHYKTSCDV